MTDSAMAPPAQLSTTPSFRSMLRHVTRVFQANLRERLAAHGISEAEYVSLFTLRRQPNLSNAELSRWTGVSAQGANQVLKNLIDFGLVERSPSPAHARILQARLTARGEQVVADCEREAEDLEEVMFQGLDDDEVQTLGALLRRCADGLGAPIDNTMMPAKRLSSATMVSNLDGRAG